MKKSRWLATLFLAGILVPGPLLAQSRDEIAFPAEYLTWARVKSMVILEGHEHFKAFGGFHHVYANEKALAALKRGVPHAKGAILVFELFEAITENDSVIEGARLVVGVMEKDPERFSETAGWGFEDFKGADRKRAVTDARTQCLSCHATRKATDYVYSTHRE